MYYSEDKDKYKSVQLKTVHSSTECCPVTSVMRHSQPALLNTLILPSLAVYCVQLHCTSYSVLCKAEVCTATVYTMQFSV